MSAPTKRMATDIRPPVGRTPAPPVAPVMDGRKFRFKIPRRWVRLGVLCIVAVAVGMLGYGYISTKRELTRLNSDQTTGAQPETERLVRHIGAHLDLPDETPTLATVEDAGKLATQEFFSKAQNGDKVLLYAKAERAVLYRPSTQKIIEYSKIDLQATP